MIEKMIEKTAKTRIGSRFKYEWILEDIPEEYLIELFNTSRKEINFAIFFLSFISSLLISLIIMIYDFIFGIFVFIIFFLCSLLLFIRKIRRKYLKRIIQVEQFSDLICREILLIYTTTHSLSIVIDYLSSGNYPIISKMLKADKKKLNLGKSPIKILRDFALKQPSESLREFIIDILLPLSNGKISSQRKINFEAQWRIRQDFESYISQLEGKMSLFLAITTIIPLTISMLLVMFGYVSTNLVLFLPLLFFVFDLIAVEIYNSGKIDLLGGNN